MAGNPSSSPDHMISLHEIDDKTLEALLAVAMSDASPEEVMPRVAGPPGWNAAREAAFRSFHRSRRGGLDGPHAEIMLAILDGDRVVGAGRLARSAPGTLETGMWLARSARCSGIGTKALETLKRRAAAEGATCLIATTMQGNAAAIGALRKCGAAIAKPDEHGHVRAEFAL